jgi:hypothetical protein
MAPAIGREFARTSTLGEEIMRRTLFLTSLLMGLVCLTASPLAAEDCRPINVRIAGPGVFIGPCSALGMDFDFCLDIPLRGTLNGTWHYYNVDGNGLDIPVDPPYPSSSVFWALGAIETNRGDLYLEDITTIHWGVPNAVVAILNITGGTGKYDGATGWFGAIDDGEHGWVQGEVCTP